jgi:DNA-binding SARP family transcriptional activator
MTDAVERAGRDIDVRPREYQVLAALAIAGTAISIERFTDELWPEADPAMATQALRMTVHRLRRALGDVHAILSVRAGYQLAGDVAIDLVEANEFLRALRRLPSLAAYDRTRLRQLFEQLTAARLGEPATDNSWTRRRDRTIARLRHEAGMLVAEDELAQDQPLLALEAAETLLRFDELDEPAIEIMLRALTQSGQRLEAARRYRDYVEQLAAEMQSRPAFSFEG